MTDVPSSHRNRRRLRDVLHDPSQHLVGTFVLLPRIEIVESLALAGFEVLIIDLEHAPIAVNELPPLAAAAQGAGVYILVRVGDLTPVTIGAVLDSGVDGVVVPHVGTADDARRVVSAGRYPPDGDRSLNPYVRAAAYQVSHSFMTEANQGVALLVMVEGEDGIANLDALASVSGVDGLFVGPVDLSAAVGFPGQPGHPEVVTAIEGVVRRSGELGVGVGVYCPDADAAKHWRKHGARLCVLSADVAMAFDAFRHYRQEVDHGGAQEGMR